MISYLQRVDLVNVEEDGGGVLSPREREVLILVARGARNREIAQLLGISVQTVKNHLHNSFGKLRVRRRREAAGLASSWGELPTLVFSRER